MDQGVTTPVPFAPLGDRLLVTSADAGRLTSDGGCAKPGTRCATVAARGTPPHSPHRAERRCDADQDDAPCCAALHCRNSPVQQ